MTPNDINEAVTHGNLELQRVLRAIVQTLQPSFIPGNIYVLFNTSDEAYVQYAKDWDQVYPDGTQLVHTSLANAEAAMKTNRNDVLLINGHNSHTVTAVLAITKNRLHFYGMGDLRRYGQAAKINIGVTTNVLDIAAIKNTGIRNSFINLKISSSNTLTEGKYAFAEGGEYTVMDYVELYLSSQLAVTDAAELLMNGDSFQGKRLTIGSNVAIVTANGARPNILLDRETIAGKVARDVTLEDCVLWRKSADADNRFVYGSGATDVERQFAMVNCRMHLAKLSSTTMLTAVHTASAQTEGYIVLDGTKVIGDVTNVATQTGIFVEDNNVAAGKAGKMLQAIAQ